MEPFLLVIAGIWIVFLGWLFIPTLVRGGLPAERKSTAYFWQTFAITAIAVIVISGLARADPGIFRVAIIPETALSGVAGTILVIAGLGFSAYARIHLGKYWSSMVMIKTGHQLVMTGPYRFVRNPMYTGMIVALLGAVIAIGMTLAFIVFPLIVVGIWLKIRAEEKLLAGKFGEEYEQYRRDVKALIPWIV